MRWFKVIVTSAVFSTATQVGGQEPAGVIIRNPYYQPEVQPIDRPTEARPVTPMLSFPGATPVESKSKPPLRVVSSSQMMRALRDAVHTPATQLDDRQGVASLAPGRFVPAADAAPIAVAPTNSRYDQAIVTASAVAAQHSTFASPNKPATVVTLAPTLRRGLLKDAVDANLEVTRLSSNPLRDSTPTAAPMTLRVANPLR